MGTVPEPEETAPVPGVPDGGLAAVPDHAELCPATWVAGVSDVGRVHHPNEDAMAAQVGENHAVLVVCDGVSASTDAHLASRLAADQTASKVHGWYSDADQPQRQDSGAALLEILTKVNAEVVALAPPDFSGTPPVCTLVAAVTDGSRLDFVSVGDTRLYWVPETGETVLPTIDDTMAQQAVGMGMSQAEAEAMFGSHTITNWVGREDAADDAQVGQLDITGPGWVVLCSDGLWNYCPTAEELGRLVLEAAWEASGDALELARHLVDWANAQGGRDNVTVVCARIA